MGTATKGQIAKEDFKLYDGTTSTFTRKTSSGGTTNYNLIDWVGVDVLQTYGSGTSRTKASIDAAQQAIGTTAKTKLFLSPGAWTIDADLTINSNCFLDIPSGATIDGAFTLTINSPEHIDAAPRQVVFGSSITVSFTKAGKVWPNWWGEIADGNPGDDVEIQKALDASIGGTCELLPSDNEYLISAPIVINAGNRLIGSGTDNNNIVTIKLDAGVDDNVLETDTWTAQTGYCHYFEIANLRIDGNKANNASTSAGIAVYGMGETARIHRVFIDECNDYGLQLSGVGAPCRITNVTIQDSGVSAILDAQTGAAITTYDSISGDNNIIFAQFTDGPHQAVFMNPKIEGEHDPVWELKCTATSEKSQITVIGGYANAFVSETNVVTIDTAGGVADSVTVAFLNFRQFNYTNLFNDVDNSQTYAAPKQALEGVYTFGGKIRCYGPGSEMFVPYNLGYASESSLEGTEVTMMKHGGSSVNFDSGAEHFTFRGTGMSGAMTWIKHKTTELTEMSGATVTWTDAIPAGAIALGVTARVTELITGATTADVGESGGTTDLFVNGMPVALDTAVGVPYSSASFAAPKTYQSTTSILVTGQGGSFTAGALRLVLHYIDLTAPTS